MGFDVQQMIEKIDAENREDEEAAFGTLYSNPTFLEIKNILEQNPLLVGPALKWLKEKQADMVRNQLLALYSAEELEEMRKQLPGGR